VIEFCIYGRDDDYMPDFLYRMRTCINHFVSGVLEINKNDFFKLTVVDWGSKPPLQETLQLIDGASEIVEFINLTEEQIKTISPDLKGIHATLPHNLAIRRSSAKYFFGMGADTMLTSSSLLSLYNLCENSLATPYPMSETYLMIERKQIPWRFFRTEPNHLELDRFIKLSSFAFHSDSPSMHWGGGAGVIGMHKNLWEEAQGLDERSVGWGGNDIDIFLRMTQKYNWMELSSFGILSYHMEHLPGEEGGDRTISMWTPNSFDPYEQPERKDKPDWGAPSLQLLPKPYDDKKERAFSKTDHCRFQRSFHQVNDIKQNNELVDFVKTLNKDIASVDLTDSFLEKMILLDCLGRISGPIKIATFDIRSPVNLLCTTHSFPSSEITSFCSKSFPSLGNLNKVIDQYRTTTNFRGHVCFAPSSKFDLKLFQSRPSFDLMILETSIPNDLLKSLMKFVSQDGIVIMPDSKDREQKEELADLDKTVGFYKEHGNILFYKKNMDQPIKYILENRPKIDSIKVRSASLPLPKFATRFSLFNGVKSFLSKFGIGIYRLKNNPNPPVFD
jgi:hypothetical protein